MGIFNNLLSRSKENTDKKELPWTALNALHQLEAIAERSKSKVQVIFKYSTRCGISRMVLNQFEKTYDLSKDDLDLYFLDLINYRMVSNEVAQKFHVIHESPQLLAIKNGAVVAHGSHSGINAIDLNNFI